jgi:thioredoxin 1
MLKLNNGINLVKFSAEWCMPCKIASRIIEYVITEFSSVIFTEIDTDDSPTLAHAYKIKSLPTVIIFNNNEEVERFVGSVNADKLRKSLENAVNNLAV